MSASFEIANTFTKAAEGGLTDDPADRGGITNYGVCLKFLRDVANESQSNRDTLERMGIRLPITRETIKALTPDHAVSLFRWQFWSRLRLDDMPLRWACLLYDAAVNHGRSRAVKLAQQAYNTISPAHKLAVDGLLGPLTRAALAQTDTPEAHEAMLSERWRFYENIMARDPSQRRFHDGWRNRVNNLRRYIRGL